MKALPRELRARCEALTNRLSDPNMARSEEQVVRAEVQLIIDHIEAHKAQTMIRLLGERKQTPTTESSW
jgi:hypothetical protein